MSDDSENEELLSQNYPGFCGLFSDVRRLPDRAGHYWFFQGPGWDDLTGVKKLPLRPSTVTGKERIVFNPLS
jgi:hypothetical protein